MKSACLSSHIVRVLSWFFSSLVVILMASSCNKNINLDGTLWSYQDQYCFVDEGLEKDIDIAITLGFQRSGKGTVQRSMKMDCDNIGLHLLMEGKGHFTYTQNENKGTMDVAFTDANTNEVLEKTVIDWRYDPEAENLILSFDENYQKQWHLGTVVFSKILQ